MTILRPIVPPQVRARAVAAKANGIMAVWLSCHLDRTGAEEQGLAVQVRDSHDGA